MTLLNTGHVHMSHVILGIKSSSGWLFLEVHENQHLCVGLHHSLKAGVSWSRIPSAAKDWAPVHSAWNQPRAGLCSGLTLTIQALALETSEKPHRWPLKASCQPPLCRGPVETLKSLGPSQPRGLLWSSNVLLNQIMSQPQKCVNSGLPPLSPTISSMATS